MFVPNAPACRKVVQLFFFLVVIGTLRRLNLNLRLQDYVLDCFGRRLVSHLDLELNQRHNATNRGLNSENLEIEIRHLRSDVQKTSRFLARLLRRRTSRANGPNGADEFETFIDRSQEVVALSLDAIDEQSFDIFLHRIQNRILPNE